MQQQSSPIVRYGGGFLVVCIGFAVAVSLVTEKRQPAVATAAAAPQPTPAAAQPAPPPAPAPPTRAERVGAAETFRAALAAAWPAMTDTRETPSDGAILLAAWMGADGRLADVKVARDETSLPKAMKDIDAERGRRLCVSGRLIQIQRDATVWVGTMMSGGGNYVHYYAAGSSGELVAGSQARLCGVITGALSYSNVGGGTTHSVQVVGVFDLRENR